ncbi:hypothetical protein D3C72_1405530 [compost metagenome]
MHRIQLLRALVLVTFTAASLHVFAAAKVEVYAEFNKEIESLPQTLAKEKDKAKRFSLYLKSREKIENLRKKNPRQLESQEINMSLFMNAFTAFPSKAKDFKAQDCAKYQTQMRKENQSYMSESEPEVYVDKALKLAEVICK